MKSLLKATLKIIVFGVVLFGFATAYRLFGDKNGDEHKDVGLRQAQADTPPSTTSSDDSGSSGSSGSSGGDSGDSDSSDSSGGDSGDS